MTEKTAKVSIHTPVWGVTYIIFAFIFITNCFNPHARVGRDNSHCLRTMDFLGFNPHARVGRDLNNIAASLHATVVSIHTPVWGVTQSEIALLFV